MNVIEWEAPAGFHLFQAGWDPSEWAGAVTAATPTTVGDRLVLAGDLRRFAESCLAQEDPAGPVWVVAIANTAGGQPFVCVTGRIDVGPMVDLDEVAAAWRSDQSETHPFSKRVAVSPSHRAPAIAGRQVFLQVEPDGRQTYREAGAAVMLLPRLDRAVRLELTTSDLTAFDDMVDFLLDTIRTIKVTTDEESRAHA